MKSEPKTSSRTTVSTSNDEMSASCATSCAAASRPSGVATGAKYAVVIARTIMAASEAGTTAETSTESLYAVIESFPPRSATVLPSGLPTSGFEAATTCAASRDSEGVGVGPNPTEGARNQSSTAATGAPCAGRTIARPPEARCVTVTFAPRSGRSPVAAYDGVATAKMRTAPSELARSR